MSSNSVERVQIAKCRRRISIIVIRYNMSAGGAITCMSSQASPQSVCSTFDSNEPARPLVDLRIIRERTYEVPPVDRFD